MFTIYKHIWLCGLPASGKTTVLRLLRNITTEVNFLNDSLEMLEFINNDIDQKHHIKPTPESFIITDSEPPHYSIKKIIEKISQSDKPNLIELSRGIDKLGVIDFSYKYFFSQLPVEIFSESLFVYLSSPFEERVKRNSKRPSPDKKPTVFESFYCPQEAMDRFFSSDDFSIISEINQGDFLIINNIGSEKKLEQKIGNLFNASVS